MLNLALRYLADDPRLYTVVGSKRDRRIVLEKCSAGCGLYCPYVNLPRGRYYVSVRFAASDRPRGHGLMDVCRDTDGQVITSALFDLGKLTNGSKQIGIEFELYQGVSQCQVRLHCAAGVSATIESLEIEFRDVDTSSVEATVRDGLGDPAVFPPLVGLGRIRNLSRVKQMKEFIRHPLAYTRRRFETALIERLVPMTAWRTAEILDQGADYQIIK
jgi:hypothetical protein